MRPHIFGFVLAIAMIAQPAWAQQTPNGFSASRSYEGVWVETCAVSNNPHQTLIPATQRCRRVRVDPCGVSHNPHQNPGEVASGQRCRRLLAEMRAAPDDLALRERCDRAALARTGRRCV